MRCSRIQAYVGIDPTAESLHIGHLVPLMPLFWMYLHGYGATTLIGGATAKIGDPTDRLQSRERLDRTTQTKNMTKIHYQLKRIWLNVEEQARRHGYKKTWAWRRAVVNNNTWWNKLPMLEVLRRVGDAMRVGPMLSRDTYVSPLPATHLETDADAQCLKCQAQDDRRQRCFFRRV